ERHAPGPDDLRVADLDLAAQCVRAPAVQLDPVTEGVLHRHALDLRAPLTLVLAVHAEQGDPRLSLETERVGWFDLGAVEVPPEGLAAPRVDGGVGTAVRADDRHVLEHEVVAALEAPHRAQSRPHA